MSIKIKTQQEFDKFGLDKKYLLAISGGLDSRVLFSLMKDLNLNFSTAHAQFGLRGADSHGDEKFVRDLSENSSIVYYTKKLNVEEYMYRHKVSLQMAARDLRYDWFFELKKEHQFDYIVTAHHLHDSVESFFINILRGTGIKGLTGIDHRQKVIRPLQRISIPEIKKFADENKLTWREDSTNADDNYLRNKIRHHLIPQFKSIDEDFEDGFLKSIDILRSEVDLINKMIKNAKNQIFIKENNHYKISIQILKDYDNLSLIHKLLSPYGFHHPLSIQKLMNGQESAEIKSENYRLIKHREFLLLHKILNDKPIKIEIHNLGEIQEPIHLRFKKTLTEPSDISGVLDFSKIIFPLSLRIRKSGDRFQPHGMKGKSKKISKFFKDLKLSKIEKENLYILCNADGEIIGIPGLRWDERFTANKDTNKWLLIEKLD